MREKYLTIQYLRAFSALLVVMHHARNPLPWLFNPLEGFQDFAKGVDLFFVISGFIMASVGVKESPSDFARKRIIRVAPIYWIVTTLLFVKVGVKSGFEQDLISRFALSLAFIPHVDPNGDVFPLLIPGWTLNYEMFFYGVFCLCLFSRRPVFFSLLALTLLVVAGLTYPINESPIYSVYTNVKLVEFAAGLLVGKYRYQIMSQRWMVALLPVGLVALFLSHHWASVAMASFLVVVSFLAIENNTPVINSIKLVGDASYVIYLSHQFVIEVVHKIFFEMPVRGGVQFVGLLTVSLLLSCAVGVAGHKFLEKPLTKYLNGISFRRWAPTV